MIGIRARFPLILGGALAGVPGCVHAYQSPTPDQPHAVLKLRRTYEMVAGNSLHETAMVEDAVAFDAVALARLATQPRTDAFLVRPEPITLSVRSSFFHTEMRMVSETYYEQVPYTEMESYNCGSGTNFQTCTRMATHYRSEPRTRFVNKMVEISDGDCTKPVRFFPQVGRTYLVQYTYQEHAACALSCFEQSQVEGGTFANAPCPPAPPAE